MPGQCRKTKKQLLEELSVLRQRLENVERLEEDSCCSDHAIPGPNSQLGAMVESFDTLEITENQFSREDLLRSNGILRELAEHRRTAHALRESEARYRSVVDHIGIGVSLISPNMEILTINNQMKRWFPHVDVSTKPICYEVFNEPPRQAVCSYCPTYETLQDGEVHEALTTTPTRNGIKHYRIIATPIKDDDGKIMAAIEMVEDMTDKYKMHEKLRESETKYRTIFETTASATMIVEEDTTISLVNTEFEKMSGYSKSEIEGKKSWTEFIVPEDLVTMMEYHRLRRVEPDGPPRNYEFRVAGRNGQTKHFSTTVAMLPGTTKSVVSLMDITQRKQIDRALQESERQLRFLSSRLLEAQEEERKKIARELHDSIGQSMVIIRLHVGNILNTAEEGGTMEEMINAMERLIPTIQDAVEETKRICTGLRPSMLDDLGIIVTIRWFCRDFQAGCPGIHIERVIGVGESGVPEPLKIVIFRVIQEALNNIAKYSNATRVDLALVKEGDSLRLTITDDGVGFDLDAALAKNIRERGLGLSGMRERTELSGGSFVLESSVGNGTRIDANWVCKP